MCKKSQLSYGYPMVILWVSYGAITITIGYLPFPSGLSPLNGDNLTYGMTPILTLFECIFNPGAKVQIKIQISNF